MDIRKKLCPFCKVEINADASECLYCHRVLKESSSTMHRPQNHEEEFENKKSINIFGIFFKTPSIVLQNLFRFVKTLRPKIWLVTLACLIFILSLYYQVRPHDSNLKSSVNNSTYSQQTPVPVNSSQINTPSHDVVSLSTGTIMKQNETYFNGLGELQISNGTSSDSVAKLTYNGRTVYAVYIKSNSSFTIKNISDGNYKLLFTSGLDWDKINGKFLISPSYEMFDDDFDFTTTTYDTYDTRHTKYSTFEVTLNPVIDGTAKTSSIDESQFKSSN